MSYVKVYAHRVVTDELNELTGKPIVKTTYHTGSLEVEREIKRGKDKGKMETVIVGDPETDVIKSVITDGDHYYSREKLNDDELLGILQGNCKRLGNPDLHKVGKRLERMASRITTMRKQANANGGYDLLTEEESNAIYNHLVGLVNGVKGALFNPITGGSKTKVADPDIF